MTTNYLRSLEFYVGDPALRVFIAAWGDRFVEGCENVDFGGGRVTQHRFKTPYLEFVQTGRLFVLICKLARDDRHHEGSSVESALKDSRYWCKITEDQCL